MSLPRPGHDYCPSCYGGPGGEHECLCNKYCRECGGVTNHTTRMHQEAERVMCHACDEVEVHDEDTLCAECAQTEREYRIVCACYVDEGKWQLCADHLSEQASYYTPDEGGSR